MSTKEAGNILSDLRQKYTQLDGKEDEKIANALEVAINLIGNVEDMKELMSAK